MASLGCNQLIQVVACHLFTPKPLLEPINFAMVMVTPSGTYFNVVLFKIQKFCLTQILFVNVVCFSKLSSVFVINKALLSLPCCLWKSVWLGCTKSGTLTHLPLDKMAAILQTIFSDAFSWMKSFVVWLKCLWSLFLRVQLTITQYVYWLVIYLLAFTGLQIRFINFATITVTKPSLMAVGGGSFLGLRLVT